MIPPPGPYGSISDIGFPLTPAPTGLPEILTGRPRSPSCASSTTTISTAAPPDKIGNGWKLPDAFQAAIAILHDVKLCTRNTKDFNPQKHPFVEIPYLL
jgi:hypothetical protein